MKFFIDFFIAVTSTMLVLLAILFILFIIFIIIDRSSGSFKNRGCVKLGLKDFKTIYEANSLAIIENEYATFVTYRSDAGNTYPIRLSFPAWVWFCIVLRCKKANRNKKQREANLEAILRDCQKVIDRKKAKAREQIDEAKGLVVMATKDLSGTEFNFKICESDGYYNRIRAVVKDDNTLDLFIINTKSLEETKAADITLPPAEVINLTTFLINNIKGRH